PLAHLLRGHRRRHGGPRRLRWLWGNTQRSERAHKLRVAARRALEQGRRALPPPVRVQFRKGPLATAFEVLGAAGPGPEPRLREEELRVEADPAGPRRCARAIGGLRIVRKPTEARGPRSPHALRLGRRR